MGESWRHRQYRGDGSSAEGNAHVRQPLQVLGPKHLGGSARPGEQLDLIPLQVAYRLLRSGHGGGSQRAPSTLTS